VSIVVTTEALFASRRRIDDVIRREHAIGRRTRAALGLV
jgi:hypothetical protein